MAKVAHFPHYNSGWCGINPDETITKTHDLGTTDLLVQLVGKTSGGKVHQKHLGGFGTWDMPMTTNRYYGAYVGEITPTQIKVYRMPDDEDWAQFRVMMWKT